MTFYLSLQSSCSNFYPLGRTDLEESKFSDEMIAEQGAQAVDFRGEALTFKATTAGVLARLQDCLDLFVQSQDSWRKRLEREVEKRKKLEELYKEALEEIRQHEKPPPLLQQFSSEKRSLLGPDYQEGPHSTIGEDEFYDAVEAGLDKIDEEQRYLERLKSKQVVRFASQAPDHPLWTEVS